MGEAAVDEEAESEKEKEKEKERRRVLIRALRDQSEEYINPVSTSCGRCGRLAAKDGSWLLDSPLETVCAACFMAADGDHVEALIADQVARFAGTDVAWKSHQTIGARFLAHRRYAALLDDMGLGKTRQALVAIPPRAPVVVLAPKSVVGSWPDEIRRWRPDLYVHKLTRTCTWPGPGTVCVLNYEALPEGRPAPGTVFVLDEPHLKVKNPGAEITLRVRTAVRWAVVHGGRCWLLTGTPLTNNPSDMFDLLDVCLLAHAVFGNRKAYRELFAGYYEAKKADRKKLEGVDLPTVRARLARVAIRRLKSSLPDAEKIPDKQVRVVPVEISPEDGKVIHEHVRRLVATKRTNEAVLAGILKDPRDRKVDKATREARKRAWDEHRNGILAYLDTPDEGEIVEAVERALEHQGELPGFEELAAVRSALATAKIRAASALADQIESWGEAPLFFCSHRMPIDALGQREGWAVITGSESVKQRKEAKDAFQEGRLRGLGIMIRAGGAGLTLTRAAHEVFVDRDYTSIHNEQAEGRAHRFGQLREVTVWRMIANHAVDKRVEEICEQKANLIHGILGEEILPEHAES